MKRSYHTIDRQGKVGERKLAGPTAPASGLFLISLSGGYQGQAYADARYGQINVPDVTADVLWSPTLLTQVDAKFVPTNLFKFIYRLAAQAHSRRLLRPAMISVGATFSP